MTQYPVRDPSSLEMVIFDAGLVQRVSLAEIYDIKAATTIQQVWQNPYLVRSKPDVHNPSHWANNLYACIRWEFFAYTLRDCQRVLDVGCGDGWPSLYLAGSIPEVVGVEISPGQIALARNTAHLAGLDNLQFQVGDISELAFPDQSFDGVCFGGNVFTYGFDTRRMLKEIHRVLRPEGTFVFEQWPVDPNKGAYSRIQWFIDGGPPIIHYGAGSGLFNRSYFVYIKPTSEQGRKLADVATRMRGELTDEQHRVCEEIVSDIETGATDIVEKAIYSGEDRSLAAEEFPVLLEEAGFEDFQSWALPDAVAFAKSLKRDGVLGRLQQEDMIPLMRALICTSKTSEKWDYIHVTCRKAG